MELLLDAVRQPLTAMKQGAACWVAFSGGLDSHVLLHLAARIRSEFPFALRAVYVNHGISPHATAWAAHCETVCRGLQVDFFSQTIPAIALDEGASLEALMRQSRYRIFSELLAPHDVLLTAHHQDDQAETLLLQLLRGAGPKGLAAMPRVKSFAKGTHARPLLGVMRAELQAYAKQHDLQHINDESNRDVNFTRNYLRLDVLPLLQSRWPTVAKTLARSASHCAEMQDAVDEWVSQDLENSQGQLPNTLSIQKIKVLSPARQRLVLRAWLSMQGFPLPSTVKLQTILKTILTAREDKQPHITWRGIELRRHRDDLCVMFCLHAHDATQIIPWDLQTPLELRTIGIVQGEKVLGQGLRAHLKNITVRFRQGGERLCLQGQKNSRELKKLFQEWGVPSWQRDRIPLIYVNDELAMVVGYGVAAEYAAREGEEGVDIQILIQNERQQEES